MKYQFRVRCSPGVSFLTKEQKQSLVTHAIAKAEKMELKDEDAVILNDARSDLKIVIRWAQKEIYIMTVNEAEKGGLPSPSDN